MDSGSEEVYEKVEYEKYSLSDVHSLNIFD